MAYNNSQRNNELNDYLLRQFHNNSQKIAQQEINDHERLSQPFRKFNLGHSLAEAGVEGGIAATSGAAIGAATGALAGGIGAAPGAAIGAASGFAGGSFYGFVKTTYTDTTSGEWKNGTMQPPRY